MYLDKQDLILASVLKNSQFYLYRFLLERGSVEANIDELVEMLRLRGVRGLGERSIYESKKILKRFNVLKYTKGYKDYKKGSYIILPKEEWNMDRIVKAWRNRYFKELDFDDFKESARKQGVPNIQELMMVSSLFTEKEFSLIGEIIDNNRKQRIPRESDLPFLLEDGEELYYSTSIWMRVGNKMNAMGIFRMEVHNRGRDGTFLKLRARGNWNDKVIFQHFNKKHKVFFDGIQSHREHGELIDKIKETVGNRKRSMTSKNKRKRPQGGRLFNKLEALKND